MEYEPSYGDYLEDRSADHEAMVDNAQREINSQDRNSESMCQEWNGRNFDTTYCDDTSIGMGAVDIAI